MKFFLNKTIHSVIKRLSFALLFLAASPALAQTTVAGSITDFGKEMIISYYDHFNFNSDTLQLDDKGYFRKQYSFKFPTYIRVTTTQPVWFSPFLIVKPNEHLEISKSRTHFKVNGSFEKFNNFMEQLNLDVREKFQGVKVDNDQLVDYKLNSLTEFFTNSTGEDNEVLRSLSTLDAIVDHKLYPLMVKWNADSGKMQNLARSIKKVPVVNPETDLTRYLDRINFDSKDLAYAGIPSISMINNLVRILRMHEVLKDTLLKDDDEYLIERRIIKSLFNESPFRAKLLGFNLSSRISNHTKYPTGLTAVDQYIGEYTKEKFTSEIAAAIYVTYAKEKTKLGTLAKGAKAPPFNLPDSNGKQVSLSDFKGKVVYLDIWATWCGPCIAEMPYLQTLREKYTGKDVAFVAISIDTDTNKWLTKMNELNLKGIQLIDKNGAEKSRIATDYKVHGVPHYVLIDKNGKIASAFAPIPSSTQEIETEINRLLK